VKGDRCSRSKERGLKNIMVRKIGVVQKKRLPNVIIKES